MSDFDTAPVLETEFDGGEAQTQVDTSQAELARLEGHLRELEGTGAISRANAAAMVEDGVALPATAPLNSFTADPSTTNLHVAQEGLISSIVGKLKDLAKAIVALMRKALDWVIDLIRKIRSHGQETEKKVANVRATSIAHTEMSELHMDQMEIKPSAVNRIKVLDEKLEALEKRWIGSFNDLTADFVTGCELSSIIRSIMLYVPEIAGIYEMRMSQYLEIAKKAAEGDTTSVGAFAALASLESFPRLNALVAKLNIRDFNANGATLVAAANMVRSHLEYVRGQHTYDAPSLDMVTNALAGSDTQLGVSTFINETVVIKTQEQTRAILAKVESHYNSMRDARTTNSDPISRAEYAAIRALQDEGNAINRLIECGAIIDRSQAEVANLLLEYAGLSYAKDTERANGVEDRETREKAKQIHTNLNRNIKR